MSVVDEDTQTPHQVVFAGPVFTGEQGTNTIILDVGALSTLTLQGPMTPDAARPAVKKSGQGGLILAAETHAGTLSLFGGRLSVLFDATIGTILNGAAGATIDVSANRTLTINQAAGGRFDGTLAGAGRIVKDGAQRLALVGTSTFTGTTTIRAGELVLTNPVANANPISGRIVVDGGVLTCDRQRPEQIPNDANVTVNVGGRFNVLNGSETVGILAGAGHVHLETSTLTINLNGAGFSGNIEGADSSLTFKGVGDLTLPGTNLLKNVLIAGGTLVIDGTLNPSSVVELPNTTLRGTGTLGTVRATNGVVVPGTGGRLGVLHAADVSLTGGTMEFTLDGPNAGAQYNQLDLAGNLTLAGNPRLTVFARADPRKGDTFRIVTLAAGKTVTGTFDGLPEGAIVSSRGRDEFSITYRGGDGNDVVLTSTNGIAPKTYLLSEGATGGFFDTDILIANPNGRPAPVTLTFSKENGEQIVTTRSLPPWSRLTVHVDQIPGLEETAASTRVTSDDGIPLIVERSMFWDARYYAGDTGSAVDTPSVDWFFAEGSQGTFATFVLVINPNAAPTDVTFTFLRESEPTVQRTVTIGANTRFTLFAGDVPELRDRSFGIAVHATQPIMAERAMYFGQTPTQPLVGGHESAGVTAASTRWFLAEGATGSFFDTFVLLSNPQTTTAHVTLRYLLDTGDTITVAKTIAPSARLTTSIEAEDDVRLHDAAVSTVVTSDVPIIAERSMYWPGVILPWAEGHNSFGVVDAGLRWGLAEGRDGGPLSFHTYILLANPQTTAAEVRVRFVRETGEPVDLTYVVPPTSRFNIDTREIDGVRGSSFGADIQVVNETPIIVERSMYWDVNGVQFSGGTNATGIRLPLAP